MLGINKIFDLCVCSFIIIFDNFFIFYILFFWDFEVKGALRNLLYKFFRIFVFFDLEWMFNFW